MATKVSLTPTWVEAAADITGIMLVQASGEVLPTALTGTSGTFAVELVVASDLPASTVRGIQLTKGELIGMDTIRELGTTGKLYARTAWGTTAASLLVEDVSPLFERNFTVDLALGANATFTRSTTGTYVNVAGLVATAAINAARFDYSRGTPALLMEPAATNLCLQSEVAGTTWSQTNVTIAANSVAAPDGATTADTLTAAADNATWVQTTTSVSAAKTWSIWLKRKTGTGAISMSVDGGSTYTVKTITADWARYSITQTLADPSLVLKIATSADAVYVWGSQLEVGSVPSSYIPTTTVAVTRTIDALAYTGVAADNETRFVVDGLDVDADDWNGTMPTPSTPDWISSVIVYYPGQRPD
jgi:hypothetical protein